MRDEEGACTFVNKPWSEHVGRPAEALLGDGWTEDVHPDDHMLAVGEPEPGPLFAPYARTYRLRSADDTYRWCLDRGMPYAAPDGRFIGYVGALVDIDDHRRVEQELRQAVKMEAVGLLTGGIAHDFNNLLSVILGNLEMMSDESEPDDWRKPLLSLALEATMRSATLTHQLLTFSRRQALQPRSLDLNAQVERTVKLLGRVLSESITVDCRLAHGLWRAFADSAQVENALINLAVNSRDAMPQGGRLVIQTENVPLNAPVHGLAPGDYVLMRVSDTGTGMSPEVLARAVEPFYTTKEVGRGSGLGLSTIHGFAEQSGGKLVLESEVGRGTTASLFLPRAAAGTAGERTDARSTELPHGRECILVVEDHASVRRTVVHQLAELGYRTLEASDASEAMALLADREEVDLVLTDIVMPRGVSGFELADQARAQRPQLRVLFTSGYSQDAAGRRSAAPFLAKPYRRSELAQMVRQALDLPPA
jgi:PAS domain S-box-containing protein